MNSADANTVTQPPATARTSKLAVASLCACLVCIVLLLALITAMALWPDYFHDCCQTMPGEKYVAAGGWLSMALLPMSFVLSIVSWKRINSSPQILKGKWACVLALAISLLLAVPLFIFLVIRTSMDG